MAVTQTDMVTQVWESLNGELSRAEIKRVLDSYRETVKDQIYDGEAVSILGLVKVNVKHVPAKPRRKGINPFNPEAGEQWFPAKPESLTAKAVVLAGAKGALPTAKSAQGKQIIARLTAPKKKAPAKKAAPKRATKGRK